MCDICNEEDPYEGLWKYECPACYEKLNKYK
jgi:hypothetical protein